ncbi:putative zinc-binding oxidoreductase ToxD [Saccharata proteae CBS 121410]|uniref:Putative zinc-binding oxidoreductase ToxD n=1 Tax=Saccharata proteae CBS 121410 TaxID=1314787 RepID=A0A6A5YBM2_9PEZI|nr:putative zinc-binding oxidoreductase ToxD [Saccharata proteae CBS 121410]
MKVVKIQSQGKAAVVEAPLPKLRPSYILVKNVAVALNPTDWKHVHNFPNTTGCTAGCDFAGIVAAMGENVTAPLKVGSRVCGFAHGGNVQNHEDGAFGEYLVAKDGPIMEVPDNLSFEEAATLGVGVTTVGQGLYQSLGLPLPDQPSPKRFWVFIYGGSTATGALAIQYAKCSGLDVVTTCSPRNFDLVKKLGASEAFDYNSPTCGADIRKYTNNACYFAFDCISEGISPKICAEALTSNSETKKPAYSALLACDVPREDVEKKYTLGYTVNGEFFTKGKNEFPAKAEDYEFGKMFWQLSQELFKEGKVKVHTPEVREGGLEGVLQGMEEHRLGKVSGKKLVYRIES